MRILFISTCDANAAQGILSNYGHPLGLCRQGGPYPHHNNQFVVQGSPQLNSLNINSANVSSQRRVQVVSQNSALLAPLCVDAVLHIGDLQASSADLRNIKVPSAILRVSCVAIHICTRL